MNTFGDALPRTDAATVLFALPVLAIILRERMWRCPPADRTAQRP